MTHGGQLEPPVRLMDEALRKGRVIPFLGAGASLGCPAREAGSDGPELLPSGSELAGRLATLTEFPAGEGQSDLAMVAQYFEIVGGRTLLNHELHSLFARGYVPSALHRHLAALPVELLIVTTNYDDLIERAFDEAKRPYDVVVHTTDASLGDRLLWWPHGAEAPEHVVPKRLDIDLATTTVIYKMHGAVDPRLPARDQYVITENDYIDFLTRLTKHKAMPAIFAEPFQTRHFLFLGYGLRDWNLRVILNRMERDVRGRSRVTSWAIDAAPSPIERRFWQDRGVEVFTMKLEAFVDRLTGS